MGRHRDLHFAAGRRKTTAHAAIPDATFTLVEFDDPLTTHADGYDPDGLTTTAPFKFTAPVDGVYMVSAHIRTNGFAWPTGVSCDLWLFVNGAGHRALGSIVGLAGASQSPAPGGAYPVNLSAGHFVDARVIHFNGSAITLDVTVGYCWFSAALLQKGVGFVP